MQCVFKLRCSISVPQVSDIVNIHQGSSSFMQRFYWHDDNGTDFNIPARKSHTNYFHTSIQNLPIMGRQKAEGHRTGEFETSEQTKTNHQRILRKLVCSFLMEPQSVPQHINAWLATGCDSSQKLGGKQGIQSVFNATQGTKTFQVFRVTDLSTSNDAVSQQIPAGVQDRENIPIFQF